MVFLFKPAAALGDILAYKPDMLWRDIWFLFKNKAKKLQRVAGGKTILI